MTTPVQKAKKGRRFVRVKATRELSIVDAGANLAYGVHKSLSSIEKAEANWAVGANRDLEVKDSSWDGAAAKKRVFAWAGFDDDDPDPDKAKQAFLVYDSANAELRGSYKLPFADIVDDKLVAITNGLNAAASRLSQTDIPDDVKERAQVILDHYSEKTAEIEKSMSSPNVTMITKASGDIVVVDPSNKPEAQVKKAKRMTDARRDRLKQIADSIADLYSEFAEIEAGDEGESSDVEKSKEPEAPSESAVEKAEIKVDTSARARAVADVEAVEKALTTKIEAHDEKLTEIEKARDEKLAEIVKSYDEKLAAVEKAHGEKLAEIEKANSEKLDAMGERCASLEKALEEKLAEIAKSIEALAAESPAPKHGEDPSVAPVTKSAKSDDCWSGIITGG